MGIQRATSLRCWREVLERLHHVARESTKWMQSADCRREREVKSLAGGQAVGVDSGPSNELMFGCELSNLHLKFLSCASWAPCSPQNWCLPRSFLVFLSRSTFCLFRQRAIAVFMMSICVTYLRRRGSGAVIPIVSSCHVHQRREFVVNREQQLQGAIKEHRAFEALLL